MYLNYFPCFWLLYCKIFNNKINFEKFLYLMVTNSMTCKSITLLCSTLIEEENCIYKDIVKFIVKYVTIWKYSIPTNEYSFKLYFFIGLLDIKSNIVKNVIDWMKGTFLDRFHMIKFFSFGYFRSNIFPRSLCNCDIEREADRKNRSTTPRCCDKVWFKQSMFCFWNFSRTFVEEFMSCVTLPQL